MRTEHCRILLSGLVKNVELRAVADLREDRRVWAKNNLPNSVEVFVSPEALFESIWEWFESSRFGFLE